MQKQIPYGGCKENKNEANMIELAAVKLPQLIQMVSNNCH